MASRRMRVAGFALACGIIVVLDQLIKMYMRDFLTDGRSVTLIPGVMDLHLVFNQGAAFGLGEGGAWIFVAIAILICAGCAAYVIFGRPSLPLSVVLGVAAGGGVGNLIDRVATGSVTDFFMPTFVHFAVFNVADIAITCGFVLAVVLFWRAETKREAELKACGTNPKANNESSSTPSTSAQDR